MGVERGSWTEGKDELGDGGSMRAQLGILKEHSRGAKRGPGLPEDWKLNKDTEQQIQVLEEASKGFLGQQSIVARIWSSSRPVWL